jgi:hypothetical protein
MRNCVCYSSDIAIWDSSELATLCLFYDTVALRALSKKGQRSGLIYRGVITESKSGPCAIVTSHTAEEFTVEYQARKFKGGVSKTVRTAAGQIAAWERHCSSLYKEGVLWRINPVGPDSLSSDAQTLLHDTLPGKVATIPASYAQDHVEAVLPIDRAYFEKDLFVTRAVSWPDIRPGEQLEPHFLWRDVVLHNARVDLDLPMFYSDGFWVRRNSADRKPDLQDIIHPMTNRVAKNLFRYVLPQVVDLHPEEILRLREQTKENRAGFSLYVTSLISDFALQFASGADLSDLSHKIDFIVTTKIAPELNEFEKKLASTRTVRGTKLLDAASRILQIEAAPWTPKFIGSVIQAVFPNILPSEEERRERNTNKYQAMQFMSQLTTHSSIVFWDNFRRRFPDANQ